MEHPATTERDVYTLADLRRWPEATAGLARPLRLAVFGDPVAHSASPPMHNAALAALELPMRYTRIQVRAEELKEALGLLAPQGFVGVNLTLPHKVAALPLLDEVDPHAAQLGAVNTIKVEADGRLVGYNTDGRGFVQAVKEEFSLPLSGKRVLILGAAGGAGRALAAQCILEGCKRLMLANRTDEKAHILAQDLQEKFPELTTPYGDVQLKVVAWELASTRELLEEVDLVVNATPLGLKEDDLSPLSLDVLPLNLFVFDTVYRSLGKPTPLIAAASEVGARSTDGLALLLQQGMLAFERWFGQRAPLELMKEMLRPQPQPTAQGANEDEAESGTP